jgi:hypothetical protein
MSVLLAYLVTRDPEWEEASLRVLAFAKQRTLERVAANLRGRLDEGRIEAEVEPVEDGGADAVAARSSDAALVFLPLRVEGMRVSRPIADDLPALLARLPVAALVAAAQDVRWTEEEEEAPPEAPAAGADDEPADAS